MFATAFADSAAVAACPEEMNIYNQQILSTIRSVPGVSGVAAVTGMPLLGTSDGMSFRLADGPTYSRGAAAWS